MAGRDRYGVKTECPECHQVGRLHLSEDDHPSFISDPDRCVDKVEGEFSASMKSNTDVDIVCNKCSHAFVK